MSSSESPAVGPDRAALEQIRALLVTHYSGQDPLPQEAQHTYVYQAWKIAVAELAASGAGPTEPSEVQEHRGFTDEELDQWPREIGQLRGQAYIRLDQATPVGENPLLDPIYDIVDRLCELATARQREQEPASDRYFTPQPVDAPPRETP